MKSTATIKYNSAELEIHYDYTPGDPGVYTRSNGDPGDPPTPPEFELNKIFYTGKDSWGRYVAIDVTELFSDNDKEEMEVLIERS